MPDPTHHGSFLLPILIFLAAAVVAVPLFRLIGLGAVIGYLAAGVAIGPAGFGLIGQAGATLQVAELGVVLLLFIIGLELQPSRVLAMRRDIGLLGSAQMAVCALVIGAGLWLLADVGVRGAALAGAALAFSATAIALQSLEERGALQSAYGQRAFAVLLFQDVLVVPVLAVAPLLAGAAGGGGLRENLIGFAGLIGAFALVLALGRYALNPLFAALARAGAREVMTAAALLVVLGAAVLMQWAGLSMALGAFLAGLLLSESHFRHQLEADIEPFRGLLMGLFFMSVGMTIDGSLVIANAGLLIGAAAAVTLVKGVLIFALMRSSGSRTCEALAGASVLTPAGEFSFVIFPLAASLGLLGAREAALLTAVAALTMIAGPLVARVIERLADRARAPGEPLPAETMPDGLKGAALVIGFGRFGQMAVQVLLAGRADVTVIDKDVERIRNAARFGFKVWYGDGARLDVLRAAGAGRARLIAVCVDRRDDANRILDICKAEFPMADVHVRAYDRIHALELLARGADRLTRETFESALTFGGEALTALTGDRGGAEDVVSAVRQRDLERLALQQAGGIYAGGAPYAQSVRPEPLTKPTRATEPLNEEARDIVQPETAPKKVAE